VGVGGILLIPALVLLGGMPIHQASATALFSFLFTGLVGTWLFHRRGSIDWRMTVPVCVGAVVLSYVGAMANSMVEARPLALIIALLIFFAGAYILLPPRRGGENQHAYRDAGHSVLLLGVGAVSGFGSGLSGAGGPLFSVPLMLVLGFAPLATVGASQVLQIVAAVFGTVGNLQFGSIDFVTAAWVTVFELGGVIVGARAAHVISIVALRRMAATLCVIVGVYMLMRSL
jgi:uncharacterized protein